MKLSVADRLLLFAGALVALLAGVLLMIGNLIGVLTVPRPDTAGVLARWSLPILGLLLFLFGVYVLALLRKLRRRQDSLIVAQTDNGEMRISVRALEDIVRRCVRLQPGLTLRDTQVARQRDQVKVEVRVTAIQGIDLTQAVVHLQQTIQRDMQASAGIKAADIRITVDSAPQGKLFDRSKQRTTAEQTPQQTE